ncbi:MAG: OmpA family protein [Myxococcaceae bacterium]
MSTALWLIAFAVGSAGANAPASAGARPDADLPNADGTSIIGVKEGYAEGAAPDSPATRGQPLLSPLNLRHAANATGGVGLLRIQSADLGRPGILRFSAWFEHFRRRGFPEPSNLISHTGATFSASMTPFHFLELGLHYRDSANYTTADALGLLQAQGDLGLSARISFRWLRGLWAGVGLIGHALSAAGDQDARHYAFGLTASAFATVDPREWGARPPLRFHVNVEGAFDDSARFAQGRTLTTLEEYGRRVNIYPRLRAGIGVEAPLPWVTPFLEYRATMPLGVPNGRLALSSGEDIPWTSAVPHDIVLGARLTAIEKLSVTVAAELGVNRTVALTSPGTPPFMFLVGLSYAVDPFHRYGTRFVDRLRERVRVVPPKPTEASVHGIVRNAKTGQPVSEALLQAPKGPPPIATAPSGRFLTQPLSLGKTTLTVTHEGYYATTVDIDVRSEKSADVEIQLQPTPKPARLWFTVRGPNGLVDAEVEIRSPETGSKKVSVPKTSLFPTRAEVRPGALYLIASSPGFLAQSRELSPTEDVDVRVTFDLSPAPRIPLAILNEDKIDIFQRVNFAFNKSTLLTSSYPLLNQVLDILVRNDIKRAQVAGHTDNVGGPEYNQRLSEARARSVVDYLVKRGFPRTRLEAAGYGRTRPIAPNLTPKGRQLNRRVEFLILER